MRSKSSRTFDRQAAKKGAKQPDLKTLGGHGKGLHRLTPPKLEPKEGFELPTIIEIPSSLTHEGETITFTSANYAVPGWLRLKTSSEPLRGNLSTLNAIDFIW
jgi:hypothetical protein